MKHRSRTLVEINKGRQQHRGQNRNEQNIQVKFDNDLKVPISISVKVSVYNLLFYNFRYLFSMYRYV